MRFDPDFANPGALVATAVEDAHRLEKIGRECFSSSRDTESKEVDAAVGRLVEKLGSKQFDYPHAWAIVVAVNWFWEHQEQGIDIKKDPWWTLGFRRKWKAKEVQEGNEQTGGKRQRTRKKLDRAKGN
jgi:hypothetical protein